MHIVSKWVLWCVGVARLSLLRCLGVIEEMDLKGHCNRICLNRRSEPKRVPFAPYRDLAVASFVWQLPYDLPRNC